MLRDVLDRVKKSRKATDQRPGGWVNMQAVAEFVMQPKLHVCTRTDAAHLSAQCVRTCWLVGLTLAEVEVITKAKLPQEDEAAHLPLPVFPAVYNFDDVQEQRVPQRTKACPLLPLI